MSVQSYPLSSLQQGMLYHALSEPSSGVDIEQLVLTLREPVDGERMRMAWQRIAARFDILRTSFRWDMSEPLQEVSPSVAVPFSVEESSEDEAAFAAWLQADRRVGFAMDRPPLMRVKLFRLGDGHCRMVWTFHHALLDGRSFPIVLEGVLHLYEEPDSPEPPPPKPYRDFIDWQTARSPDESKDFWTDTMRGFRAPTPLPVQGLDGCLPIRTQGDAEARLDKTLTKKLADFAAQIGVTMNTLVQGAWAILLSRYSGEEDVCFGSTRACRKGTIDGAENCVGLFINTVPVRAGVEPSMPVAQFLKNLRKLWVDIRPHEHTPLSKIQLWSQLPAGQPMFRTLVVFEKYDLQEQFRARGSAWGVSDVRLHEQTNFPICLAAYASEEIRLVAEYDRSMLDDATVGRLLGHLTTIFSALPECETLGEIPLLTAHEYENLVIQPPATVGSADPRNELTLHALFRQRAASQPNEVALVQGDERLTYRELDDRSNAVAAELAKAGVLRGSIVGLCMERVPSLVVALIGILKAGAAYLPIDLAYPADRLAFMLADAKAPVLLTQRHLAEKIPADHGARALLIEDMPAASAATEQQTGTPEDLCYVLYTSGSTGKPKGCCITHRNVMRLFTATEHWFHFSSNDVWTLFHSTAFDFSVWELWGALLYGGKLVVVPFETSRSPELFHGLLVNERVTVLNQTPSAFRQLIAADALSPDSDKLSLRTVVFGGEALEMQSLRPWFERHGDSMPRLVNMYGITETTVHVTYRPLSADDLKRGSVIGEPIPDLQVYILDPQMRPSPIGVPGELYVGGNGLAREYLGRPELTAQRFIENPFSTGTRLYRTGDLARRLPNRDIEYLGRIDQQVKIRGFRIELGEIESHLISHPGIREAAVLPRDGASGKRLVAWFVPNGPAPSAMELRAHLRAFTPDYMVPAAYVAVERMPLTNNGKLDQRALPEPPEERRDVASQFVAPTSDVETKLAEIWQRLLKIERVGIHDNFFELGGDSILSILMVTQARQHGITLSPKQLFDHPTIAALAALGTSSISRIVELPQSGSVPLSPIQRWFFDHQFADAHHWNQSFALRLKKCVPPEKLATAISAVLRAHPIFRLRFDAAGNQYFAESPSVQIEEIADVASFQSSLRLDGPLARFGLVAPDVLIIAIHHLLVDGVSWRILLEDIDLALQGKPLPATTTGFHTWSAALRAAVSGAENERPFWQNILAASATPLPRDHENGENSEASAGTVTHRFSTGETAFLLSRLPNGIRTQDALLAALAESLHAWTGEREFTIETEGHGREESVLREFSGNIAAADLTRTIGWFTTIYPVRLRSAGHPNATLFEAARAVRHIPNRGFGYPLLRHLSANQESVNWTSELLFNYLGQFDSTVDGLEYFAFSEIDTGPWHAPAARRTHLLEINALVLRGQLEVRFTFSKNIHRVSTIEALAGNFAKIIRSLSTAAHPLSRLEQAHADELTKRFLGLEDIYPLSAMQRLFLAMESARPGSGSDQWHCHLRGNLHPGKLIDAWKLVAARHTALRSGYIADDSEPFQFVLRDASPEVHFEDLSHREKCEQDRRFAEFLARDVRRPFDLTQPPLTRFAIFKLSDSECRLVWTHHHIEIDGWSWPLVFHELSEALSGRISELPPVSPYRDFIGWLAMKDETAAERFWRLQLAGFAKTTPLPFAQKAAPASSVSACLDSGSADALNALARQYKVTANALVQAAWAALLAHHGSISDVVFGAAFSGRPADLHSAERIVGHFVNNLPIRVSLSERETLVEAAISLHTRLAKIAEFQNTDLAAIQSWSELPWHSRLFDSLIVFQNYVAGEASQKLGDIPILEMHAPVQTNYPLTAVVKPGRALHFTLLSNSGVASPESLATLIEQWLSILKAAIGNPALSVRETTSALVPLVSENVTASDAAIPKVAASTQLESQIGAVWAEAFGRTVSVTDNFFDLGGHSLMMMRVRARLNAVLGREIPVVKLFQHPTISALAKYLGGESRVQNETLSAKDRAAKARAALTRRPLPPTRKS